MPVVLALLASLAACNETGGSAPAVETASDIELASFEALYEMTLGGTRPSANVSDYDGLMSYTMSDTCDGWASSQRTIARIGTLEGDELVSEFTSNSWESDDQTRFRFSSMSKLNGEITREVRGDARREDFSKEGEVVFDKPEAQRAVLPANVYFPNAQTIQALDAARAGARFLSVPLFDGAPENIPYDSVTVIGDGKTGVVPGEEEAGKSLANMKHWPMHIGYHEPDSEDGLPDFEMEMEVYENGVSSDLLIDYGDYTINGRLIELRMVPGGC